VTTARKTDPIRKITTRTGEVRYRFIIDVGKRPDGKRDQRCFTYPSLREARSARAKIISDRSRGALVKPTRVTFDDLSQRWLDSRHDVREVTRLGYRQVLKPVQSQLGPAKVQDLSRSDIERLIRTLREERGLSHRSVVYTLGAIRQVLAYGISEGRISVNVAASVKAPRKQHGTASPRSSGHLKSWSSSGPWLIWMSGQRRGG
jgi:hypothetical protein